jgi:hypothetical protein
LSNKGCNLVSFSSHDARYAGIYTTRCRFTNIERFVDLVGSAVNLSREPRADALATIWLYGVRRPGRRRGYCRACAVPVPM